MRRKRRGPKIDEGAWLATSVVAGLAFGALSLLVRRHDTIRLDGRVRRHFPRRRSTRTKRVVSALAPLGKGWVQAPAAMVVAGYVKREGGRHGSEAISLASTLAPAVENSLAWLLWRRQTPPGRHSVTEPSFPSGHSLNTAAVALTSGYVLWREGLVDWKVALPVPTAVPVGMGVSRMYMDRHWGTDALGGWVLGVSIAALCAAGYESRVK